MMKDARATDVRNSGNRGAAKTLREMLEGNEDGGDDVKVKSMKLFFEGKSKGLARLVEHRTRNIEYRMMNNA